MGTAIEREPNASANASANASVNESEGNGARLGTALRDNERPKYATTAPYQRIADDDRGTGGQTTADGLGYFSIALGLAELLAPDAMARLIGVTDPDERNHKTMRVMGLREIAAGVAILASEQPAKAVWARVAGDTMDLALLGKTLSNAENNRGRTLFATANVAAVTALDVKTARLLSKQPRTNVNERASEGIMLTKRSVTVNRPVEEVYAFWRNFENLPRFMRHLESVIITDDRRSHWTAVAPGGKKVEWDAELLEDRENEFISWRSLPGSDVYNAGSVAFLRAPGNRGTEVRITLEYDPPFGKLGSRIAKLWREEPGQQVEDSLRQFKQVMETGEVLLSDATKRRGLHPAQPDNQPAAR
jgi:uncharacterized membrane protein